MAVKDQSVLPAPPEAYNRRIYTLAVCASMGSAMFGYDSAFIGGTLALPSFKSRFGLDQVSGNALASLRANTVSTFQAGCFFGALLCYYATEKLGRKRSLIGSGAIFNIGVIFQLASNGRIGFIYAGRAITGLGVGASSLIVPVYISECSPPAIRGRMIGIFEVFLQVFQVIGFWVNYAVNIHQSATSDSQWLIPFAFQLVPGTALVLTMLTQPESPRWLVKAGKMSQARTVLAHIRNVTENHPYITWELQTVESQLEHEMHGRSSKTGGLVATLNEMVAPRNRTRIFLDIAIMLLQNLVGANAINYYSPSIFASIGLGGTSVGLLATGVYGIVKVIATAVFIRFIVDRFGRRPPLLVGSTVALSSMLYLGVYSAVSGAFSGSAPRDAGAYTAVVFVYIYAVAFCCSWNSIAWIFCAEIFPLGIRSVCLVTTTCSQWLGQFIVIYSTPYMMENIMSGTFFLFAGFIAVGAAFAFFLIPETAGLSLEDMDVLFATTGLARKKRYTLEANLALERQGLQLQERMKGADGQSAIDDAIQPVNPSSTHVEST